MTTENKAKKVENSTNARKISEEQKEEQKKEQKRIQLPAFVSMESALGAVSMLAMKSKSHKHLFITDYEWLIMPPIALKQFVLFRTEKNEPVSFVSWASVNDEVEKRLLNGVMKLKPQEWNSGNKLYIIDMISPFGIGKEILKQLHDKQFKDKEVMIIRPKKDGKGVESKSLKDLIGEFEKDEIKEKKE